MIMTKDFGLEELNKPFPSALTIRTIRTIDEGKTFLWQKLHHNN